PSWYECSAMPICFRLLRQRMRAASACTSPMADTMSPPTSRITRTTASTFTASFMTWPSRAIRSAYADQGRNASTSLAPWPASPSNRRLIPASNPLLQRPTSARYGVLAFACSLSLITYLDRICIMRAREDVQSSLRFDETYMGWIFGAFSVGYMLFEVPG